MNPIKVLVVEDEVLIAETIRLFLEERGHIFLKNAISYEEAIDMIELDSPDIVLLDIRLYGIKSGIDVAKYLSNKEPLIPYIFLTSHYDKNVLNKALATNPSGYLTKPISKESLWATLELVFNNECISTDQNPFIIVKSGNKSQIILEDSIMYIQAKHVYVSIFTKNNKIIVTRSSLTQISNQLDNDNFIHCHRSYIINTDHVSSWTNSELVIRDKVIPISKSKKSIVIEQLSK